MMDPVETCIRSTKFNQLRDVLPFFLFFMVVLGGPTLLDRELAGASMMEEFILVWVGGGILATKLNQLRHVFPFFMVVLGGPPLLD
jgi:hypothetical protein